MSVGVTRLAPSPTGALHLGNARTFVINYLMARTQGWRVLMRIEDLDGPRMKQGAVAQTLDDLRWLGLEWEEPVVHQSSRDEAYRGALQELIRKRAAYPCTCSRKDIELAGAAPHLDDPVKVYPGTCRGRWSSAEQAQRRTGRPAAWRVTVEDRKMSFVDEFAGPQSFNLSTTCGDFVVFRNEGLAGYQLAVVLDDAAAGVNRIVRGDDLLESTARQMRLRELLNLDGNVKYWHLPLVIGQDGRRLAKRHGDTRLSHYRQLGATPERVLGLLAYWSGLIDDRREATMAELLDGFHPTRVPMKEVVFCSADEDFLRRR